LRIENWLLVIEDGRMTPEELTKECDQLCRIFGKSVSTAKGKKRKPSGPDLPPGPPDHK